MKEYFVTIFQIGNNIYMVHIQEVRWGHMSLGYLVPSTITEFLIIFLEIFYAYISLMYMSIHTGLFFNQI